MANQSLTLEFPQAISVVSDAGLFVSICTIQAPTQTPDSLGQVDLVDYTNVSGLVNLQCVMSPMIDTRPNPNFEKREQVGIDELGIFHVLLYGYYPQILQKYRAVVDATPYDIMTVESDSQKIMTRLAVRRYTR